MSGNALAPVDAPGTTVASLVFADVSPALDNFTLSMATSSILMSFTDVIDASTFDPTALTVLASRSSSAESISLTATSTATQVTPYVVNVSIGKLDSNNIKFNQGLATNITDTYISMSATLMLDAYGVPIAPVTVALAIQASDFTKDEEPAQLIWWAYDAGIGKFTLHYNEAINGETLDVRAFLYGREATGRRRQSVFEWLQLTDITSWNQPTSSSFEFFYQPSRHAQHRIQLCAARCGRQLPRHGHRGDVGHEWQRCRAHNDR
jgi:hypothetical protein